MRVPKTVQEEHEIEKKSGTDFCTKSIEKEMVNVRIEFDKLDVVTPD